MAKEATDNEILEYLKKDSIGRNQQLGILIKYITTLDEPTVIGIDDAWGTGKTVFVKQMQVLAGDADVRDVKGIDMDTIDSFRSRCAVHYFNAWEYDYMKDPLCALAFNLVADFGVLEKARKTVGNIGDVARSLVKNAVTRCTDGFVDIDGLTNEDIYTLAKSLNTAKKDVEKLIGEIQNKYEKSSLVIIIDEIDRCKPSFAVDLLEVVKHYFQLKGVIFVVATNNKALACTVRQCYGQEYDGGAYLERFFDVRMFLRRPKTNEYMKVVNSNYNWCYTDADIIDYYGLSMREIRHYYTLKRMTDGFTALNNFDSDDDKVRFAKYIALPIILAMTVTGDKEVLNVLQGRNVDAIWSAIKQSKSCKETMNGMISVRGNVNIMLQRVTKLYESLFNDNEDISIYFREAATILSNFTSIDAAQ